jgi:hypothetical protein
MFSASTVAKLPALVPVASPESAIEARLPRFLVATLPLGTPLWKWMSLVLLALVLFVAFRLLVKVFNRLIRLLTSRFRKTGSFVWVQAIVDPLLVLLIVVVFRIFEG